MRIVFMGTPQFAVPALDALVAAGHNVVAVYSQPPRPAGRGQQVQKSPVQLCAEKHGIPVFTPKTLKTPEPQAEFAAHNADVAIVAAYGLILPKAVLDAPKHGCINIHASLLPRWRGASPIQHAIWMGDAQSGVTIMQMDVGLDTGAMLKKGTVPITQQTTCQQLHDALSAMGGKLVIEVLENINSLSPEKQDDAQSNYAPMLKKEDGKIDWSQPASRIDCQIRALNPWPGTFTTGGGKRLKVLEARPEAGSGPAGTVLNKAGHIACGKDALKLIRVQPDGGKPMDFAAALNGNYIKIGDVLV
ncbi:MAG: methionyl-tRNA formyltransferase [Alphaproteobacteria bacterium]|nr:methionyl-tRNA formyltransferase [Alphaproteobacteria bacterium]